MTSENNRSNKLFQHDGTIYNFSNILHSIKEVWKNHSQKNKFTQNENVPRTPRYSMTTSRQQLSYLQGINRGINE